MGSTVGAIWLGLWAGRYVLPLLQASVFFPIFYLLLRAGRWSTVVTASLWWAFAGAAFTEWISYAAADLAGNSVLMGETYQQEMFEWIRTGVGRESSLQEFLPQHLLHLLVFVLLTLASGGLLGLVMGAVLINYMSFYVASLLLNTQRAGWVLLLGWPPWAAIRVVAFILAATALSALFYNRFFAPTLEAKTIRQLLKWGIILLVLDVLLKWWLAPWWRLRLHSLIEI